MNWPKCTFNKLTWPYKHLKTKNSNFQFRSPKFEFKFFFCLIGNVPWLEFWLSISLDWRRCVALPTMVILPFAPLVVVSEMAFISLLIMPFDWIVDIWGCMGCRMVVMTCFSTTASILLRFEFIDVEASILICLGSGGGWTAAVRLIWMRSTLSRLRAVLSAVEIAFLSGERLKRDGNLRFRTGLLDSITSFGSFFRLYQS